MIISVINHTNGKITDETVHEAVRAVNRQIAQDFEPYWSLGATLRLEGRSEQRLDRQVLADMRGDAVLYLWSGADVEDALGYHDRNHRGIPFGMVFIELSEELDEPWTVTLSHEALELIADPDVNLLVQGPHPAHPDKLVFHWYEMCDAVQAERYSIEGLAVSNFLLPLYFTGSDERGSRNDFLGRVPTGRARPLQSFGINPGGYIGLFDPATGEDQTVSLPGDEEAARRLKTKSKYMGGRRALRYHAPEMALPAASRSRLNEIGPAVTGVEILRRMPRS